MACVLTISSRVARGSVGLCAIVPALHALGHEVVEVPTVLLSSHPGHGTFARHPIDAADLDGIVGALDGHGWLAGIDAVLTGYLPTLAHVMSAARIVALIRERAPGALVVVDPVCGDDPKGLYLPAAAAAAVRDSLVPLADVILPNRFELEFLSGRQVRDAASAVEAAGALAPPVVVATSIPGEGNRLATLLVDGHGSTSLEVARRHKVPNGTGDLLSGLVTGCRLAGAPWCEAVRRGVTILDRLLAAGAERDELAIGRLALIIAVTA